MRPRTRSTLIGLGMSLCLLAGPTVLAATVSGPIGATTLSQGDRGFPVRVLQGDLAQLGDYGGVVTGYFGPGTAAALRRFQRIHGLSPTGVLGAATLRAIEMAMGIGGGPVTVPATGTSGAGSGTPASNPGSGTPATNPGSGGQGTNPPSGSPSPATNGGGNGAGSGGSTPGAGGGAGGGAGAAATFVQGTGTPSISGGLQVGGTIDGLKILRVIHLTATAYGATAQDNYPYGAVDAFGAPLRPGDVAVDPSVIPLNTRLYVTGYSSPNLPRGGELAVARDTGGAIKGSRIDMYINSTNESVISAFGIQHVTAYVLGQ